MDTSFRRIEQLRGLVEKTTKLLEEDGSLQEINDILKEQNDILEDLESPTMEEVLLNLQTLEGTGAFVRNAAQNLNVNNIALTLTEIADRWHQFLTEDGCNERGIWEKLERIALPNMVHNVSFCTDFDILKSYTDERPVPKKKEKGSTQKQDTRSQKVSPKKVQNKKGDEDSDDQKVKQILECLTYYYNRNNNNPVNFYQFVLHPHDYMASIRNMSLVSFLIKDGLAGLSVDNDVPFIHPLNLTDAERTDPSNRKYASLMNISKDTWKRLVEVMDITEAMINMKI